MAKKVIVIVSPMNTLGDVLNTALSISDCVELHGSPYFTGRIMQSSPVQGSLGIPEHGQALLMDMEIPFFLKRLEEKMKVINGSKAIIGGAN